MAYPARARVSAPKRQPVDYDQVSQFLKALAYPTRLELLDLLRFPRTLGDIKLSTRRSARGDNPDRPASRPTVLSHLAILQEVDLVRSEEVKQAGRRVPRYEVNAPKLYALVEELRRISTRHAGTGPVGEETGTISGVPRSAVVAGPKLVLVHGVYEGKAFALSDETEGEGGWLIGRKREAPISLDYDPYVSLENAMVTRTTDGFRVEDLGSKNGTAINWEHLSERGTHQLTPGDVIGVGRSLLSFVPG